MNDKDKFSSQNQRTKKNSLDEAILGGFKSSAKRFAEYRQNSNAPDDWKGSTVTAAPDEQGSKVHSRREWVERLFQLFDQYSQDFNKLVDEPHLISACYPPRELATENPLISRTQGLVSTKHWQLLVRLQREGIAGFLLPKSMEQTFLKEESLFERIFLIESTEEYADVWSYDGKSTDYSQLPTLARRFFGSLIEIARNEEDMDENAEEEDTYSSPAVDAPPGNGAEGAASFSGEQAVFKDLLNFGQNQSETPNTEWQDPSQESGLSHLLKESDETGRIDLAALERSRKNGEVVMRAGAQPKEELVQTHQDGLPLQSEPAGDQSGEASVEKDAYWSKSGRRHGTIEFTAYSGDTEPITTAQQQALLAQAQAPETSAVEVSRPNRLDSSIFESTSDDGGESGTTESESSDISNSESSSIWPQKEANTEELEMLKTEELTIASACEMMRHSIDKELESITRSGMRAFENQDLGAIEKAMKRTKKVKDFKEQLSPVLSMWERMDHEEE